MIENEREQQGPELDRLYEAAVLATPPRPGAQVACVFVSVAFSDGHFDFMCWPPENAETMLRSIGRMVKEMGLA